MLAYMSRLCYPDWFFLCLYSGFGSHPVVGRKLSFLGRRPLQMKVLSKAPRPLHSIRLFKAYRLRGKKTKKHYMAGKDNCGKRVV